MRSLPHDVQYTPKIKGNNAPWFTDHNNKFNPSRAVMMEFLAADLMQGPHVTNIDGLVRFAIQTKVSAHMLASGRIRITLK